MIDGKQTMIELRKQTTQTVKKLQERLEQTHKEIKATIDEIESRPQVQRAVKVFSYDQLGEGARLNAVASLMSNSSYKYTAEEELDRVMEEEVCEVIAEHEHLLIFDANDLEFDSPTIKGFSFQDWMYDKEKILDVLYTNGFGYDVSVELSDNTMSYIARNFERTETFAQCVKVDIVSDAALHPESEKAKELKRAAVFLVVLMTNEYNTIIRKLTDTYKQKKSFYFDDASGYVLNYMGVFECDFLADGTYIDIAWDDYTEETKQALEGLRKLK